MKPHKGMPQTR